MCKNPFEERFLVIAEKPSVAMTIASVLARLNDKKEEVRAQPKKNTPVHAKAEEL